MNKRFYQLFWFSLFIKIVVSYFLPLVADESYYWVWSKNLQLSYFDHPAMVAWLTSLGAGFESLGHLVRLPIILVGHAALYFWTLAFEEELSENSFEFLLLLLLCPLTGLGAMLMLPDTPLLFFSGLSVFLFRKALSKQRPLDFILFGAALGLGFCSKYHIVFVAASLIAYLFLSGKYRQIEFSKVLVSVLAFFVFASPVFIWNYQNDWASFRFQLNHGLGNSELTWQYPVEYLLGQTVIIFPSLVYFFIQSLRFKKDQTPSWKKLSFVLAAFPLLFFMYSSFKKPVEPNWTVAALPAFFAFVIANKPKRWVLRSQNIFYFCFVFLILSSLIFGFAGKINTKLAEPLLTEQLKQLPKTYSPLFAINYQLASQTWYASKIRTVKLKNASRPDFFDSFPDNVPSSDFYLLKYDWSDLPPWMNQENYKIETVLDLHNELKLIHCFK